MSGQLTDREASALANARRLLDAAEAEMCYGAGCRAAALPMLYDALAAVGALVSATATELERSRARSRRVARSEHAQEARGPQAQEVAPLNPRRVARVYAE